MPLDARRIHALCFDVDGTLSNTDDQWVARMARLLSPLRPFLPQRQVRPFARWMVMGLESPGNVLYAALDRIGLDDLLGRIYNLMAHHRLERRSRNFWIIPQVSETLHRLAQDFPLSVVSARGAQGTLQFLQQFDLTGLFQAVATSQTCRYTKPYPDPVLWAAERMGVPAHNCLMVGDTVVDIRAGKAAGAQTVGVLSGFGTENELRRAGADLILPGIAPLVSLLLQEDSPALDDAAFSLPLQAGDPAIESGSFGRPPLGFAE